jgi:hypothetical protein
MTDDEFEEARERGRALLRQALKDPKPTISPEEMERRRVHVRVAIADSRLEGMATGAAVLEIFEAYIRGEIEAADLVTAYKKALAAGLPSVADHA